MKHIKINNIDYGFVSDFKDDPKMRSLFNELTQATYGFDFEFWYDAGFWADQYIPYSLVHDGKMVSNVSVSKMDFLIENEKKTGIQIGTVMTDQAYRHRGLNKFIMEGVLNRWKDQVDFIYLFANNTVLDFYPKFNFERVAEYQYSSVLTPTNTPASFKKLNVDDHQDRELLIRTIEDSVPVSKVSMRNNPGLILFYCLSFMKNNIYYIEEQEAVVLANIEGNTLTLNDVYAKYQVDLNRVIQSLRDATIKRVVLGFTPLDTSNFEKNRLEPEDVLFVYKDHAEFLKNRSWRFPVLSHA